MARKNYDITEAVIQRWIREGRGQGCGRDYRPWLTVRDVPSSGFSHRVAGVKTDGRIHHYLSREEYLIHLIAEAGRQVVDIREQYPLDRHVTAAIAKRLGVQHPMTKQGTPRVLTTDLLLSLEGHSFGPLWAIAAKPRNRYDEKVRVRQLLRIEEEYWSERGVFWCAATEHEVPRTVANHLDRIKFAYDLSGLDQLPVSKARTLQEQILAQIGGAALVPYSEFCTRFDERHRAKQGDCHYLLTNLLAHGVLRLDSRITHYTHCLMENFRLVLGDLSSLRTHDE
jgi:hypothetical protein